MDVRAGLLFLVFGAAGWACAARELAGVETFGTTTESVVSDFSVANQDSFMTVEVETQAPGEGINNNRVCTLCEEFAAEAIGYLGENKTQTEIINILHTSCSQIPSFKEQCITLVDYYAPLFFVEVSSIQPEDFCRKVNLCQQKVIRLSEIQEDSCGICQHAVSEVLIKLKDPDTQLEIIEVLLKGCNSMNNYAQKCKKLVFEYGPLILVNAEQFLEKTDICTMLHACPKQSTVLKADS
uniref:Pulmonary surfactant-associated protein B n=1 Tax=Rhizophora mucronata TaxID=61149 RepID=A0A2P2JI44_RHIMU